MAWCTECGGWAKADARRPQRAGGADTAAGNPALRGQVERGSELGVSVPSLEPAPSKRELCPCGFPASSQRRSAGVLAGKQA